MSRENYTRRGFLKAIGLGTVGATLCGCGRQAQKTARAATPEKRPNVVLILIDDMGWIDTGCYGSKGVGHGEKLQLCRAAFAAPSFSSRGLN